jgi:hypothetical protein
MPDHVGVDLGPPAASGRGGSRWPYVLAGVAGVVAFSVFAAVLASGGDPGDPGSSDDATTTTAAGGPTATSADTARIVMGSVGDVRDPDEPPPGPLLGDDWSPEARAQFVEYCVDGPIGDSLTARGSTDPTSGCGCIYEDVSGQLAFADFNDVWAARDVPPDDPILETLLNAMLICAMS